MSYIHVYDKETGDGVHDAYGYALSSPDPNLLLLKCLLTFILIFYI